MVVNRPGQRDACRPPKATFGKGTCSSRLGTLPDCHGCSRPRFAGKLLGPIFTRHRITHLQNISLKEVDSWCSFALVLPLRADDVNLLRTLVAVQRVGALE